MSNWRMPLLKQWLSAKMWRRPCYNWCFHIASRCYVKEALYKINFLLIPASFLLAGTAHRACCGRHSQSKTLLLKTTINIYNDIWQPFSQTTVFTKGNEPAKELGGGSDELPRNSQWAKRLPASDKARGPKWSKRHREVCRRCTAGASQGLPATLRISCLR